MREQFEEWFKSTKSYQMLMGMNYFKKDLFHFIDGRGEYCHSSVQIAFMTWQTRQAEIDQAYEDIETFAEAHERECGFKAQIAEELGGRKKQIVKAISKWNALVSILTTMDMVIVPDEFHDILDELGDVLRGVTK
ncbi:hypothetical protein [Acinetobacter rudis]|uniref:hypothetical protein n=1 Tax=Acinetobacter rudis TaxID=632955 RepID=UPI003341F0CF